jgi:hypothetical protein
VAVQITSDRIDRIDRVSPTGIDERAARRALLAQVAKLERELSGIVAAGFPHILPPAQTGASRPGRRAGGAPHLLDLEQLERTRDELAAKVQLAQRATVERAELETRSRRLLERMKREPARYKCMRLPVRDMGEGGCGVWEVRPRLGLIGMLAGWWQVKLSSGCPLAKGHAAAWPGDHTVTQGSRSGVARRSHRHPGLAFRCGPEIAQRVGARAAQHRDQRLALAVGHRPDRLLL